MISRQKVHPSDELCRQNDNVLERYNSTMAFGAGPESKKIDSCINFKNTCWQFGGGKLYKCFNSPIYLQGRYTIFD